MLREAHVVIALEMRDLGTCPGGQGEVLALVIELELGNDQPGVRAMELVDPAGIALGAPERTKWRVFSISGGTQKANNSLACSIGIGYSYSSRDATRPPDLMLIAA